MKRYAYILALLLCACGTVPPSNQTAGIAPQAAVAPNIQWPSGLPVYDHIVVVMEENKDYEQIIDSPFAPFINDRLRVEGASLTRMYGEEHNSQGNYFWLLSGSNQAVGFIDNIPFTPRSASNLAQQLIKVGRTFKGYAEGLPEIGSTVLQDGKYYRKHVPWISFSNIPNGDTAATSSNLRFNDFPSDFNLLPTVSFVVPDIDNDMHNGGIPDSIKAGDRWLREHIGRYYEWARTHNSLLIVTFDENSHGTFPGGLTDPADPLPENRNRIATILAGAHIKPGEYPEGKGVTHVNLLRTIEAMYGCPRSGVQQPKALAAGIADDYILTDVFAAPK
jgi:acid phosphatase